jgi:cobalamin synthase
MKNNSSKKETLVAVILVLLAILVLNPLDFWMPNTLVICILITTLVFFSVFASFVLREKIFDERDDLHRTLAGRNAFLAGSTLALLGIIIQGYTHQVDPWLVTTLILMIVVKISTRIWSDNNL